MRYNHKYSDSKPFNMDLIFLERINARLDELNIATIEGNQILRFRLIKTIFMDTFFKFSEDERKTIKSNLDEIEDLLSQEISGGKSLQIQQNQVITTEAMTALDTIWMQVSMMLYKYHIIHLKAKPKINPMDEFTGEYQ